MITIQLQLTTDLNKRRLTKKQQRLKTSHAKRGTGSSQPIMNALLEAQCSV